MRTERNQLEDSATSSTTIMSRFLPLFGAGTAIAIFILDTNTPEDSAVAVLYVGVVWLSARFLRKRGVVLLSLGMMALTVLSYFLSGHAKLPGIALSTCLLSMAAIGVTAFLAVQSQSIEKVLREQAGLLDLTHDTVFVRDMNDVIVYWNHSAAELYGWKKAEAVGNVTHRLLQTIFPMPLEEIMTELLATGRWEGELVHTKKSGTRTIVASRWSVQRDARGRPAAILRHQQGLDGVPRLDALHHRNHEAEVDLVGTFATLAIRGQ
jgi:PAS domain S-box-containing protein